MQRSADRLAERKDALITNRVEDTRTVFAAADDSRGVENAEVTGDILLPGAQRLRELADGSLAVAQPIEQLDPHRLANHAEPLSDHIDQRIRQRMGNAHRRGCHLKELYHFTSTRT